MEESAERALVALDRPSRMGLDSDEPAAAGQVARGGVALDSVVDLERALAGAALEHVSIRLAAGAAAPQIAAMYLALALDRGVALNRLAGTIERSGALFPRRPSSRLLSDLIAHLSVAAPALGVRHVPDEPAGPEIVHRTPAELAQQAQLAELRTARDADATRQALERLIVAAKGSDNLTPYLVDAARARATLGEMTAALRRVFGAASRTEPSHPGGDL